VGQVAVAERLGGETYLYIRVAGQPLVVAQAAGNDTTHVHEQVTLRIEPETCHLFDAEGHALPHLARHPLAEMRPTAPQTQPAQQVQPR
jgi:multiple sugar transport system ATP-binding protein